MRAPFRTGLVLAAFVGHQLVPSGFAEDAVDLDGAVDRINRELREKSVQIRPITSEDVKLVLNDAAPFGLFPFQRKDLQHYLSQNKLPPLSEFMIVKHTGLPYRLDLRMPHLDNKPWQSFTSVADETGLLLETLRNETQACARNDGYQDLCIEPFASELPSMESVEFPSSVPIRVTPIQVEGKPVSSSKPKRDALKVELKLTRDNLEDLASYFAVGYSYAETLNRARALLGDRTEAWIQVQELWTRWIGTKVNTFPNDEDNDVCHAPAREFFFHRQTSANSGYARSTEASGALLHRYYCPIADEVEPRFGDYLWNPGAHSGRYILKDPASGRGIGFSIQSEGHVPYRLYWIDEDFSGNPFAHHPNPNLRGHYLDIWRRCKN